MAIAPLADGIHTPPYVYRHLQVIAVDRSTPGLVRVILGGAQMAGFQIELPASWVKVFVPGPSGDIGRAYTVRAFDERQGLLEIDVVRRRRGGAISSYIYEHLQVGDYLDVAGPRGGISVDETASWHLLVGDETALPAISAVLPHLPIHASRTALVEVPFPENAYAEDRNIQFLFRGMPSSQEPSHLPHALAALPDQPGRGCIWIAGEASLVKTLRRLCIDRWGKQGCVVDAVGYWKMGQIDYRDEEAYPLV